jgi:hypothetical protein
MVEQHVEPSAPSAPSAVNLQHASSVFNLESWT